MIALQPVIDMSPVGASPNQILSTDVLDVHISALNMNMAIETIEGWIASNDPHYVEICTVHTVMESQRDPAMKAIVNNAGLRTPDGMPLVWLSRKAGHDHVSRVYGPDLMLKLAARSAETGHRHFFYGGAPGVADDLAEKLSTRFPGLHVAGTHTPPMQPVGQIESPDVIRMINESNADIVWCGLGTPKQDWWVANHRSLLDAPVLIAVGAAFDFHTGRVRQAPRWMQRNGLEWLFRLSQDPKRLWRRYMIDNARFIFKILLGGQGRTSTVIHDRV
jgi:N-acetylglucosaminyldiphosphoundecaprenol N-acetyl-beta-D-mannosaminyltransferase